MIGGVYLLGMIAEFLLQPLLQRSFGQVENISVVRLHEEEDRLVAVVSDDERLVLGDRWRIGIERIMGQHGAINDRAESAGASSPTDAAPPAAHRERTARLLAKLYLGSQQLFRGNLKQLAPVFLVDAELFEHHHGGFSGCISRHHANAW